MPPPLPSDSDDHHGRHAGRRPLGDRHRNRKRTAPPARHHHHRRPDRQPDADALHNTRGIPLFRPAAALVERHPPPPPPSQRRNVTVRSMIFKRYKLAGALAVATLLSTGCTVGPNYKRPAAPVPPAFKELPPSGTQDGWKEATPSDALLKGKWWEIYNDPALNALEEQVAINNQNVLVAEANFREARAAVRV